MVELKGRKALFFRAHIDPGVGPMPKNAVHSSEMELIELTPAGVYVKTRGRNGNPGEEHLVPYSNIQSIKLIPEETKLDGRTKAAKELTN